MTPVHYRMVYSMHNTHKHVQYMWHTINQSDDDDGDDDDGTHSHTTYCDMQMHSIPFNFLCAYFRGW